MRYNVLPAFDVGDDNKGSSIQKKLKNRADPAVNPKALFLDKL